MLFWHCLPADARAFMLLLLGIQPLDHCKNFTYVMKLVVINTEASIKDDVESALEA
jgi:hypothetical protein